MDDTSLPLHPTRARVSLSAFRHNLGVVRSYVGKKTRIMAVVKANAYGHGMLRMAVEALQHGAGYLGVARIDEALQLRAGGIEQPILVFEIVSDAFHTMALMNGIELTVSSLDGAMRISTVARKLHSTAKVHVKIDTGMGRLGLAYQTAAADIERMALLPKLELTGVYSHFSTSDEADQRYAMKQLGRFADVLEQLQRKRIEIPLKHMANSGAIIALPASYFDMVRPGIMLYGYVPRNGMITSPRVRPVMSLVSVVSLVKRVKKGTSISYGRRYVTPRDTRIATVPVGYADGYSRRLTNAMSAIIHGKRYPVVGTICMDHLMIDLGRGGAVVEGDAVTFIGREGKEVISAWDIAEKLRTIPYEVTSLINVRVPREYTI